MPSNPFFLPDLGIHELQIRTAFLYTFNASKFVLAYVAAVSFLNLNGAASIPLSGLGYSGFLLSFWIFMALSLIYVLGFKNRRDADTSFSPWGNSHA